MDLKRIFDKCLYEIGGENNRDVRQYRKRPKTISRSAFFKECAWTIWTSGFKRVRANSILDKAEKKGFNWDYNDVNLWDKHYFNKFVESLHGKPAPKLANRKWKAIYEIASRLQLFPNEKDFRKSFFDGKVQSIKLDKIDVKRLSELGLPFIREKNAQLIIRNMGGEVIKCDRWMEEFLKHYKITLNQLESQLRDANIPIGFFDLVIWAYCEMFIKTVGEFREHFLKTFKEK